MLRRGIATTAPQQVNKYSSNREVDWQRRGKSDGLPSTPIGFEVSMSGKGNCYDNSMVETFFKSLKSEMIWRNRWETKRQAEGAIFEYMALSEQNRLRRAGREISIPG